LKMGQAILANIAWVRNREKAAWSLIMVLFMKESSLMIKLVDTENISGQIKDLIKETG
jgi:hypothetical protein